ncbi:uncharacterized protein LOC129582653 isoform X2 [Paramacrobiotus metropolitanus]|uniref:uncharacterized protein LOC129582653 isoform X2 n=1 Tax=Paramacrobiotus metropolitanus TaxID=2943436 RepID=UPI002445FA1E|nr:uncharacterized protein LOC129582653 isoform X2 [Paramacrobiotus metropolitanus]
MDVLFMCIRCKSDVLQCGTTLTCPSTDNTDGPEDGAYCCKKAPLNDSALLVYCCDFSTYVQYSTGLRLMEFFGIFLGCMVVIICGGVMVCYLFGWLCFRPHLPFSTHNQ